MKTTSQVASLNHEKKKQKSWFPSFSNKDGSTSKPQSVAASEESLHRKRLAQILRYIASMHQSLNASERGHSFVREVAFNGNASDFFQREAEEEFLEEDSRGCGVLFTTHNFRKLIAMENNDETKLFSTPPFTFYAAATEQRKRTLAGTFKSTFGRSDNSASPSEKACWLRITRPTTVEEDPLVKASPAVRRYLQDWLENHPQRQQTRGAVRRVEDLLTLKSIANAPKIPPNVSAKDNKEIGVFLKAYKMYLRRKVYQQALEPMYNRLFEWVQVQQQQDHHCELVFGLGHARMRVDGVLVNGPILEVLVEVELVQDGALLIRPREHTGVALNREVVTALTESSNQAILSQLFRTVSELEPSQISPGQPATYVSILKRVAVELSSGGCFRPSSTMARSSNTSDPSKLVVSEAWCLFSRSKPSSVWARDATALADNLMLSGESSSSLCIPKAAWSLTHGPGALEEILEACATPKGNDSKSSFLSWFQKKSQVEDSAPLPRPLFPLPTSDAQNRIAELLITKNYPAVVCEGPPGTGKSHTIANIICAYLCLGKRVLVTSKNAPALSVLRNRLPDSVRELCVDVSMSELAGMRQLQKTVERLANRVSCANTEMETRKCHLLQVRRRCTCFC